MIGADLGNDFRQVFPLDVGRLAQDVERCVAEGRRTARIEDVARDADAILVAHR
jgi:hypothetical protein